MELYVARDKWGLGLYEKRPYLDRKNNWNNDDGKWYEIDDKLFPEITFKNSPRKVKIELIEE